MGLLDRFRAQPRWKHPDPAVRVASVDELPLDDQVLITSIAKEDGAPAVRLAAIRKIVDPATLAECARADQDAEVREAAAQVLVETAAGAFEGTTEADCLASLAALSDPRHVGAVAKTATLESVRRTALARIEDTRVLGSVARRSANAATRIEALARVFDEAELTAIALRGDFKDAALGAVERLTSREALQAVADRAKQKAAAKRARVRVREMDEAAEQAAERARPASQAPAAPQPLPPDSRAAELSAGLEALVRLGDWSAAPSRLEAALSAWEAIKGGVGDQEAQRFAEAARLVHLGVERAAVERAEAAERQRASDERSASAAGIIRRIAELADDRLEAGVAEATAEWTALMAGYPADLPGTPALAAAFDTAAAKAGQRRRAIALAAERRAQAEEMAAGFEQFAAAPDLVAIRPRLAGLRKAWAQLAASGPIDEAVGSRVTEAEQRLAVAETTLRETRARQAQENAERIGRVCQTAEALAASESPALKDIERLLRDLHGLAEEMGPLPSRDERERLAARLHAAEEALSPRARELRELDDWQRWANAGVQEELCGQAEAIAAAVDLEPAEAARQLAALQARWKEVAAGPRDKGQALWQRFRVATDAIRARCDQFFADQASERAANLARKESLCEQVEALAESTDWLRTAEEIKRLQAEWKAIGHVPRGHEKAVWDRFRAACDRFFTRRHEDLARRKEEWSANAAKKEALCARAEALAESNEWDQAASELKRLQAEWKAVGPVRKARSEALWVRFRAACDQFFERYQHRHTPQIGLLVAEREAACALVEALLPPAVVLPEPPPEGEGGAFESGAADGEAAEAGTAGGAATAHASAVPPSDTLLGEARRAWAEWQKASAKGGVPRQTAEALERRFAAAFDAVLGRYPDAFVGTEFDTEANRAKLEELCARIEELSAEQPQPAVEGSGSVTLLAQQLREALASNAMAGRAPADSAAKGRQAAEEIRKAQAAWRRIGPVRSEAAAPLEARFQRACERLIASRDGRRG